MLFLMKLKLNLELFTHRCLYYKHCDPVISDRDYDFLERDWESVNDCEMMMVDWAPSTRLHRDLDTLSVEQLKNIARDTMNYRSDGEL
jgi:NAD-dependent DNA ligase